MRFGILGPLTVATDDGEPIAIRGPRPRAILAALLLHRNQPISSERLAVALWGDEAPASAARTAQVHLSRLRSALPDPAVLTTTPAGYRLRVLPGELDAERFEQDVAAAQRELMQGRSAEAAEGLRVALALWRGSPLADVTLASFAEAEVTRLEERRLTALELRIEADLAVGRHRDLVAELQALVAQHPWRERLNGALMLALYRSGRQAEALAAYRQARTNLVDALGVEPGPDLRELHRAILEHDPGLSVAAVPQAAPGAGGILVAVDATVGSELSLRLGARLAASLGSELILAGIVADAGALDGAVQMLDAHRDRVGRDTPPVRAAAFTSSTPGDDLIRLAIEQDVRLMLTDAPPDVVATGRPDDHLARVLDDLPCHFLMLFGDHTDADVRAGQPVLVPFGGADHEWAAVEIGAQIATAYGSRLLLVGTRADPAQGRRDASRLLARAALMAQRLVAVPTEPRLVEPGPDGVIELSRSVGLVLIGLSPRWHDEGLGETRRAILRDSSAPCAIVGRSTRPGGLTPPGTFTRFTWSRAHAEARR